MDSDNPLYFLLQTFSRFLISGLVFYLFVILLPFILYLNLNKFELIRDPIFIILFSLIIGLLLDLSKFYRLSWKITGVDKNQLENFIVEAFHIKIDKKNKTKAYRERIATVATQIHDTYIRINYPKTYEKIRDVFTYQDILSMTFFSVCLFILVGFSSFAIYLISKIYENDALLKSFNEPFSLFRLIMIIILKITLIFVLVSGKKKVKHVYQKSDDFINSIINEAYCQSNIEIKDRFFAKLRDHLILDNKKNQWKVKEK